MSNSKQQQQNDGKQEGMALRRVSLREAVLAVNEEGNRFSSITGEYFVSRDGGVGRRAGAGRCRSIRLLGDIVEIMTSDPAFLPILVPLHNVRSMVVA